MCCREGKLPFMVQSQSMIERILKIQVPGDVQKVTSTIRKKVGKVVEAFEREGVIDIGKNDISVSLVLNPIAQELSGTRVEIVDVFRDTDGNLDAMTTAYKLIGVSFKKRF